MAKLQKQTYILSLIVIVIFGTNLIFAKQLMPPLNSISYIFMRYLISACSLIGFLCYKGKFKQFLKFLKSNFKQMALLGMVFNTGALILVFYGVKYTSSTNSFLIQNFSLFLIIILNKLIYKKNPSKMRIFSSVVVLIGMIFVMYPLDFSGNQNSLGNILTLCATLFGALNRTFNKHFCEKHDTIFVTTGYAVMISLSTLPMTLIIGEFKNYLLLTNIQWGSLIYLGIILSSIGYFMNYKIASDPNITAEMMSLLSVLTTIMGVFSGVLFLGEKMSIVNIIGAIFVFIAVYYGTEKDPDEGDKKNEEKINLN